MQWADVSLVLRSSVGGRGLLGFHGEQPQFRRERVQDLGLGGPRSSVGKPGGRESQWIWIWLGKRLGRFLVRCRFHDQDRDLGSGCRLVLTVLCCFLRLNSG